MTRVLAGFAVALAWTAAATAQDSTLANRRSLARYEQEVSFIELTRSVEEQHRAHVAAFRHVNVVDVSSGRILADMRVAVPDGRIGRIERDTGRASAAGDIDGRGQFLIPGLADMHVHQTASSSYHLLQLASGVTTVRDMAGFWWTLRWRDGARTDRILAPNMIVTSSLLDTARISFFATVVRTPEEGRAIVRAQADSGYDYIKVYDGLSLGMFDAIADEARLRGIGVVGHVPTRVPIAHAVAAGQQTIEHFTGFIPNDTHVAIPDSAWSGAVQSAAWITPTLSTDRTNWRGDSATKLLAQDAAKYVPELTLDRWRQLAAQLAPEWLREKQAREREMFQKLIKVTPRILAGSDAGGGLAFLVPGFSLVEELRWLNRGGLTPIQSLRAATLNAAEATGRAKEFGRIATGLHANLVLLARNPFEDLDALLRPNGVMVRGRWLDRAALDSALDAVWRIASRWPAIASEPSLVTATWAQDFVRRIVAGAAAGYFIPDPYLRDIAARLRRAGLSGPADTLLLEYATVERQSRKP